MLRLRNNPVKFDVPIFSSISSSFECQVRRQLCTLWGLYVTQHVLFHKRIQNDRTRIFSGLLRRGTNFVMILWTFRCTAFLEENMFRFDAVRFFINVDNFSEIYCSNHFRYVLYVFPICLIYYVIIRCTRNNINNKIIHIQFILNHVTSNTLS